MLICLDKLLSRKLSRLSYVAVVLVVFLHSYDKNLAPEMFAVTSWLQDFVSQGLSRIAVPYFFAVSGFFLFRRFPSFGVFHWWKEQVKRRLVSLVVPYFLWAIVFFVYINTLSFFGTGRAKCEVASGIWWLKMLGVIGNSPLYGMHLWYIKTLFIAVVVSPALGSVISLGMGWMVLLVGFVMSLLAFGDYGWSLCLMYFTFGGIIAIRGVPQQCINYYRRYYCWISIIMLFLWIACAVCNIYMKRGGISISFNLLAIGNVLGLVGVWGGYDCVPEKIWREIDQVAGSSFFIYCAHLGLYLPIGKLIKCLPLGVYSKFFEVFITPLIIVFALAFGWRSLRHHAPRFLGLITGGRDK